MSDAVEKVKVEWKAGIAASKANRKSIYTAAAWIVAAVLSTPAAGEVAGVCAQLGLVDPDTICNVPTSQLRLWVGTGLAYVFDTAVQFGRNYLKHKLGWSFLP